MQCVQVQRVQVQRVHVQCMHVLAARGKVSERCYTGEGFGEGFLCDTRVSPCYMRTRTH